MKIKGKVKEQPGKSDKVTRETYIPKKNHSKKNQGLEYIFFFFFPSFSLTVFKMCGYKVLSREKEREGDRSVRHSGQVARRTSRLSERILIHLVSTNAVDTSPENRNCHLARLIAEGPEGRSWETYGQYVFPWGDSYHYLRLRRIKLQMIKNQVQWIFLSFFLIPL